MSREPEYEYRAALTDRPEDGAQSRPDYGDATRDLARVREEVRQGLSDGCCGDDPYDEGWVERRPITKWERIT